jgi:hypothetical protein
MTGLTPAEFLDLLPAFVTACERAYPMDRTAAGQPRQRWPGGGRHGILVSDADKLLFLLVYLKTYPLQVVLGQLFGLSVSRTNYWLHHLLPALRSALDALGDLPERDGGQLARSTTAAKSSRAVIIDGTERRRQRPKDAEKQALHYSGKKKTHTDKNVLVASAADDKILFLSETYPGKTHDKRIADEEHLTYPPGTALYKDTGFQGYEPPVQQSCQAKKKAARARAYGHREGCQPQAGTASSPRGTRHLRGETESDCQRSLSQQEAGHVRYVHGGRQRPA